MQTSIQKTHAQDKPLRFGNISDDTKILVSVSLREGHFPHTTEQPLCLRGSEQPQILFLDLK